MKKIIPYLHLAIIVAAWTSPFWLNWKVICITYCIYLLQNFILGRCLLSKIQFTNTTENFYSYYLHKADLKISTKTIDFFVDYIIPPILIVLSIVYQKAI